jgi:hypothetical protein
VNVGVAETGEHSERGEGSSEVSVEVEKVGEDEDSARDEDDGGVSRPEDGGD